MPTRLAHARKPWLIAVAAAGGLAICAIAALQTDSFEHKLGLATRLTARWAALWFLAAFVARPLYRIYGGRFAGVLRQRRYLGLGFAAVHTIHFACFTWLIATTPVSRPAIVYLGGGAGYALMFAMAATSNDAAMRALGKNWHRLHTLGMWWLWFVFAFSYGGRIARPNTQLLGIVMTTLFVAAALLRTGGIQRLLRPRVRPMTT